MECREFIRRSGNIKEFNQNEVFSMHRGEFLRTIGDRRLNFSEGNSPRYQLALVLSESLPEKT